MALLAKAGASGCGDLTVKEADFMGYSWHIHGDKRYIIYTDNYWYIYILVGGLEHFSFFHILGNNHPN